MICLFIFLFRPNLMTYAVSWVLRFWLKENRKVVLVLFRMKWFVLLQEEHGSPSNQLCFAVTIARFNPCRRCLWTQSRVHESGNCLWVGPCWRDLFRPETGPFPRLSIDWSFWWPARFSLDQFRCLRFRVCFERLCTLGWAWRRTALDFSSMTSLQSINSITDGFVTCCCWSLNLVSRFKVLKIKCGAGCSHTDCIGGSVSCAYWLSSGCY